MASTLYRREVAEDEMPKKDESVAWQAKSHNQSVASQIARGTTRPPWQARSHTRHDHERAGSCVVVMVVVRTKPLTVGHCTASLAHRRLTASLLPCLNKQPRETHRAPKHTSPQS